MNKWERIDKDNGIHTYLSRQNIYGLNHINCCWSIGLVLRLIPSFHNIHLFVGHTNHISVILVGNANALTAVVAKVLRIDAAKMCEKYLKHTEIQMLINCENLLISHLDQPSNYVRTAFVVLQFTTTRQDCTVFGQDQVANCIRNSFQGKHCI